MNFNRWRGSDTITERRFLQFLWLVSASSLCCLCQTRVGEKNQQGVVRKPEELCGFPLPGSDQIRLISVTVRQITASKSDQLS